MTELDFLTRRRFIAALAASVVAAGMPLPIGLKKGNLFFDIEIPAMTPSKYVEYVYYSEYRIAYKWDGIIKPYSEWKGETP